MVFKSHIAMDVIEPCRSVVVFFSMWMVSIIEYLYSADLTKYFICHHQKDCAGDACIHFKRLFINLWCLPLQQAPHALKMIEQEVCYCIKSQEAT
mmetsp:Transcript_4977/g.13199  ORF Transcript_4977/g.13199 Transcript_4977/m.13199 type:complete len:95 (-) Transcript_4977:146-430(-)